MFLFLLLFSMAPELYNKEKYNEKVDIYSFGIVLYELFTEREPYAEEIKKYGANENVWSSISSIIYRFYTTLWIIIWGLPSPAIWLILVYLLFIIVHL